MQGDHKTGTKGENSPFVLDHNEIKQIPTDQIFTYANIVVDYLPQKTDPNRVRIMAGGNLINYPGELTTRTTYLTTSKILWSIIISTINKKNMCVDIKKIYLGTLLEPLEYMCIPRSMFLKHIIKQCSLILRGGD